MRRAGQVPAPLAPLQPGSHATAVILVACLAASARPPSALGRRSRRLRLHTPLCRERRPSLEPAAQRRRQSGSGKAFRPRRPDRPGGEDPAPPTANPIDPPESPPPPPRPKRL